MCVLRTNAETALSFEVKTSTFRVYPDSSGSYFIISAFCSSNCMLNAEGIKLKAGFRTGGLPTYLLETSKFESQPYA
jgi:hypothetical protein